MKAPLIKISPPTAAEICQEYQAPGSSTPPSTQTPAQYLDQMREDGQSEEAIKFLAHGMPERESTWWAVQSAKKAPISGDAADQAALQAAEAWVKNPTPATQQEAALAAAQTRYQTPGAWAAQAAAWSQPSAPQPTLAPALPGTPAVPRLTPHAVAGSVMLAAAMSAPSFTPPQPQFTKPSGPDLSIPLSVPSAVEAPALPQTPPTPQQRAQVAKYHEPFIELGSDVASGQNHWA